VNLATLAEFEVTGSVTPESLYELGLIRGLEFPVKILGYGEIAAPLQVEAHAFSASAKAQIEAAGGSVTELERTDQWVEARPRSRRININGDLKKARLGKVDGPARREDVTGS
jgi:hypothetical protein